MTTFAESNILSETRQEYDSKVDLLCEWADAYYAKDQPVVPDSVYDQLFREVQTIEAAKPEWVRLDSPTLRVGAAPLKEFGQVEHGEPMLSIDNALNAEEAAAFGIRVANELGLDPEEVLYGKEPKYGGVRRNRRNFRHSRSSPATIASKSIGFPPL